MGRDVLEVSFHAIDQLFALPLPHRCLRLWLCQMTGDVSVPSWSPPILPVFLSLRADLPVLFKISIWHQPDTAFQKLLCDIRAESYHWKLIPTADVHGHAERHETGLCGPAWVHHLLLNALGFFFNGGQCINQMEVQSPDLFYPTQRIGFVINLRFHCRLPGPKLCHWWDFFLLLTQLCVPGEWRTIAGTRCYCFSHTDFALMCQIKRTFLL